MNQIKLIKDTPFVIINYNDVDVFAICASRGLDGLFLFSLDHKYRNLFGLDSDLKLKVVGIDVV